MYFAFLFRQNTISLKQILTLQHLAYRKTSKYSSQRGMLLIPLESELFVQKGAVVAKMQIMIINISIINSKNLSMVHAKMKSRAEYADKR